MPGIGSNPRVVGVMTSPDFELGRSWGLHEILTYLIMYSNLGTSKSITLMTDRLIESSNLFIKAIINQTSFLLIGDLFGLYGGVFAYQQIPGS